MASSTGDVLGDHLVHAHVGSWVLPLIVVWEPGPPWRAWLSFCTVSESKRVGAAREARAAQVLTQRGPHYAGEAIRLVVTAVGFEEEPTPEIEVPEVPGRLELLQIKPAVSSQISITNGRIVQHREVSFTYEFSYLLDRPGSVTFPPFRVTQAGTERSTKALRLRISALSTSDEIAVELLLPDSPVFVGARLPVSVRFYLSEARMGSNPPMVEMTVIMMGRILPEIPSVATARTSFLF